ncbi:Fatty acyl-CoA reductase [Zhongshania aliphaticivorans]|uniref:Fatty acyl-CoA reductase n=1 Tax=Zhongshania aliphaticivorans TaxID=1470434 RepID=A0A5S9MZP4_9GAMM|nr:SDR family NAD(P)-dependent oxidoreductase [Zhongshania aliphaticivorans]CAA0081770.1 Fatty acyl-CoA reductase [Zhongshania aliphaticivorans]CAA0084664.1 Fatty acyl-CoA reductase [Zhongshania aliphaticivorans]
MSKFGFESSTYEVLAGVNLEGKYVVVTGGGAGLGFETARALGSKGAHVVLVGRNAEKLEMAKMSLMLMGQTKVDSELMDLNDLDSIRVAAKTLQQRYPKIDILVNNAGIMACPLSRTKQGFESQFGTNHLAHFLFTCLLAPSLIAADSARVVNLSSSGHHLGMVNFEDPNYESSPYNKWVAYGASKTSNALFAVGLNARLASMGVSSYGVHPGMIKTDLGRHLEPEDIADLSSPPEPYKAVPQGAATSVWAATAPDLADKGGSFLANCQVAEINDGPKPFGVKTYATSVENADKLWEISEALVGNKFSW